MPSSDGDLATRPGAGRSGVVASPRSKMFAGRGVGDGGMMHGTRRPFLWSEQLLEQVRLALKAEGCRVEVEIVRLLDAAPGQRNWEIATIGPNTAPPDMRRRIVDVQTRLGEKFQLRALGQGQNPEQPGDEAGRRGRLVPMTERTGASNRRATTMGRKQFKVILRHRETGEEIEKIIFAEDEDEARERATELTRHRLVGMPDRAQFDVVSCTS